MTKSDSSRSSKRRAPGLGTIIALACVAAIVAFVVVDPFELLNQPDEEAAADVVFVRGTTSVAVQNLESTFEADSGEIVFVGETTITDPQNGVVSSILPTESAVGPGDVLYVRDDQPVVLLPGAVPAWRTMTVDDVGVDVAQLEAALLGLGYGTEAEFTVDDTFTTATAAIVERWQADLGVDETGSVALGDVAFGPEEARVGTVTAVVGDSTQGTDLLTLTDAGRHISFIVPAESIGFISTGTVVSARLPDRATVEGTVTGIAPAGGGLSTVTAALATSDAEGSETVLPNGDSIPVTVTWTDVVAQEAATLPAAALLRLDNGSYAVELVTGDDETELVNVMVGQRVGSQIEILTGVAPGDEVITS